MQGHETYMQRCIDLARQGAGSVSPNPMVGAVVVHDGLIIGEGYHHKHGAAHAEVLAVEAVKNPELLTSSTLFVNLEPCAHHGLTPPCADLVVACGIPKVVLCNTDPNPAVAGKGIARLRSAGVEVITGVLEIEGRWFNRRFFTFHEQRRPYVILKFAQTNDGFLDVNRTAGEGILPFKISSHETDRLSHQWRSQEDAILIGQNTVVMDNPHLTTRHWSGKNPLRLIIDPALQIEGDKKVMSDGNDTWVFNAVRDDHGDHNVRYIRINDPTRYHHEILQQLYEARIQSILVEGGATTLSRFIESGMWDEARIITGPMRIGSGVPSPAFSGKLVLSEQYGADLLQVYLRT